MADDDFAESKAQYVASAAYHEAGHITAAVLQGMPLQERGIHTDSEGSGISYYWHRQPGDLANSAKDRLERERTIIALFAGSISQGTFFSDCPEEVGTSDRATICYLLEEMHPSDRANRFAAQNHLRIKAEELVFQNWSIIEALASALIAKPYTPLPQIEIEEKWSRARRQEERWMPGSEVVKVFEKFQIVVSLPSLPIIRPN